MKLMDRLRCCRCLLLVLAVISLCEARPSHKRHINRHRRDSSSKHRQSKQKDIKHNKASKRAEMKLDKLAMHNMISPYVHFSETKPEHSPWELPIDKTNLTDTERSKRSIEHIETNTCKTLSLWTELPTAEDMNGSTVQVMSTITIGSTRQTQYIYETFCYDEEFEPPCTGIDSTQYTSRCKTNYTFVYAYVRTASGEVGWNRIKVRGSCVCSVKKKAAEASLWDDYLKKR